MLLAAINCASVDGQHSINNYSESFPVIDDQRAKNAPVLFPMTGSLPGRRDGLRLTNVGNPITIAPFWHGRRFRLTGYHLSFFGADGVFRRWHGKVPLMDAQHGRWWKRSHYTTIAWSYPKDSERTEFHGGRVKRLKFDPARILRLILTIEMQKVWHFPQITHSGWKRCGPAVFKLLQLSAGCVFQVADFRNVHFQYPTIVWQAISYFSTIALQSKSLDLQFCAAVQMQIHWTVRQPSRKIRLFQSF